jgi:[CysO sulfur-carrier protein]-S-L-cysteine hydrolase
MERSVEDILEEDIVPPFRLILSSGVAAKIRNGIPRASAAERAGLGLPHASLLEAGGVMMGEDLGQNTFRVTDVSLTIGEPDRYDLDPAEHQPFVEAFRAKFPDDRRFGMIGSWHSHPSGEPEPSAGDLQTLKDTVTHPSTDLAFKVLLIVCLDATEQLRTGGVVLTRKSKVLSRIEVSIEPDRRDAV